MLKRYIADEETMGVDVKKVKVSKELIINNIISSKNKLDELYTRIDYLENQLRSAMEKISKLSNDIHELKHINENNDPAWMSYIN